MPTYHRTEANRGRNGKRKSKNTRQRRFEFTTPALLNPDLFRRHNETKPKRRGGSFTRQLWHAVSARRWHSSHYAAFLLLLTTIAALVYTFRSFDFFVYAADIENVRYTASTEAYQQAGIDGKSIFFIDPAAVRERMLALPHVREAEVSVALPAKILITLQEREPVVLYQVQGDSMWIDRTGFISPAADQRQGLVKLVDDAAAASQDGTIDPALLDAVRRITQNLPEVSTFRYQAPFGLFFFSPEGWQVNLGSAERMEEKLATWEAMRRDILQEGAPAQLVDLRYDRPYWR